MSLDGSQCTDMCYWQVFNVLFMSLCGSQGTDSCNWMVLAAMSQEILAALIYVTGWFSLH